MKTNLRNLYHSNFRNKVRKRYKGFAILSHAKKTVAKLRQKGIPAEIVNTGKDFSVYVWV